MAFRGNVALVTGGASGMGRLSALRLANLGAKVFAVDMDVEGLESLSAQSSNITVQKCDVSDYEQVADVVGRVQKDLGEIDRLTHAAGIMPVGYINDMPIETFTRLMRINYEGTVYLVKSVMPGMLARNRGDIICYGSIAGDVLLPETAGYCATKAATNTFMRHLLWEHKDADLRILLVCPPPVNTPLLSAEKTGSNKAFSNEELKQALKLGVIVEPEFILDAIEERIDKRSGVLYPGYFAKLSVLLNRMSPWIYRQVILRLINPETK